jgi:uroporphyrinogen decarboxylase
MTPRERVLQALRHQAPDEIPADFGGGPATMIHPTAYARLLAHLGLEPEQPVSGRGEGQVVTPSEAVLQRFAIDVRGIDLSAPDDRQSQSADGTSYVDDWGVTWKKSGPAAPYIAARGPLQALDQPSVADATSFPYPEPDQPTWTAGLRESARAIRQRGEHALVLNLGNITFSIAQRVRGFAELFEDLLINREFATALLEQVSDFCCRVATNALIEVGELIDAVSVSDDMGMQTQAYMSPRLYRETVKPHHARVIDTIRRNSDAFVILHSDGAIAELLPDFIDAGVQVINPVQVSAAGMDSRLLKREFGRDLTFWGAIDTHRVLPVGSATDVTDDLAGDGGYVIASVHNIQAETPAENVVAMFDAPRSC